MKFILNTHTGVLHTKDCAEGYVGFEAVAAGRKQHFPSVENAMQNANFVQVHNSDACLSQYA